ncbi:hypothetical protein EMA8858_04183 [Emticicia aquatica]|uniref:GmrSD restriction endonucleases N-terminal domain-containing protein n=1 Tax=Emticicia aquatica TaxID=1681835 RepID=A0ABN8EY55_9BACT|nr:DUF262 domain-containing protein [Emticicia aquatica]CAH0998048.1 hypothetical protein EMA8858_04183 [Emticicia aquatica]
MNNLQEEIDQKKKEIFTDGYPMSIGELARLYQDNELDIHPEFQRFFRWSILQKSKLIESVLLGIPIPSIFVSQRKDGVWDVVDGLQRLSTLFQFMGILKDENGKLIKPVPLVKTEYLKSLDNKSWEIEGDDANSFIQSQRIAFKREKIDIKIVKKESHDTIKFELFQRLNTLGSKLSDQEVRNCLLVLLNNSFYKWLKKLAENESFLNTLSLTDKLIEEQYNMELALRFLIFKRIKPDSVKSTTDLGEYITDEMRELAANPKFDLDKEEKEFIKTFEILDFAMGEYSFKRYDINKNTFGGKFLISGFESIAYGLGRNISKYSNLLHDDAMKNKIIVRIKGIWNNSKFQSRSGSGIPVTQRIPTIVPIGEKAFSDLTS